MSKKGDPMFELLAQIAELPSEVRDPLRPFIEKALVYVHGLEGQLREVAAVVADHLISDHHRAAVILSDVLEEHHAIHAEED